MKTMIIEPHSDDGLISLGGYLESNKNNEDFYFCLVLASDVDFRHQGTVSREVRLQEYESYVTHYQGHWIRNVGEVKLPLDKEARLDTFPMAELVFAIESVLKEVQPDKLFVTGPSVHHDHRLVFEAVMAALRPTSRISPKEVYVTENPTYVNGDPSSRFNSPDTYFALSEEQMDAKIDVLQQCFPTQVRTSGALSPDGLLRWARYRGLEAQVDLAEAVTTLRRVI